MASDGFLSRWSRRKQEVREGKPVEPPPVAEAPLPTAAPVAAAAPEPTPPPPTLEEARALTFDSDFRRFVAPEADPEVKKAAMKKLFADPRFNVRDPMDIYADDYSKPDPLPDDMLRKLASAQVLRLFEETSDDGGEKTVAQSAEAVPQAPHADPDLRLQQDDAPAGESAGDGVERGNAAAHDAVPPGSGKLPEGDPGH
jgi:hypothetical protein